MTDPRIQTISRGLIGAQQLEFELRQKSERDYVYEQLLPDARRALDSLAADLETAREALQATRDWIKFAANSEGGVVAQTLDAALARLSAGKEAT